MERDEIGAKRSALCSYVVC